jgi:CheY-like chemotaxis protein
MLNGIIGSAELINLNNNLNEKDRVYLNIILQASNRAAELISKLISLGRKSRINQKPVKVHKIIKDAVDLVQRSIDKKIKIFVHEHAGEDICILDPAEFQNALMNLFINSAQAMPIGGKIEISSSNLMLNNELCSNSPFMITPGKYIKISVQDTGTGIPEEHLEKIFEPYFTTKEKGQGSGLGLAAVYGIVKNNHGSIKVQSQVGIGTIFELFFPVAENSEIPKENPAEIVKGTGCILFVDDEEILRLTIKGMLESMNYHVILAENGIQALEKFKEHHSAIDIVILDMIMPEMNGSETFFELKKIWPEYKIIIASGHSEDEQLEKILAHDKVEYIRKPYDMAALNKCINKLFRLS